ncbi:MAG TPA: RNA polymerase factor sigma-54 [Chloroflexota bacterium]|nr:RNA polymerase factor sigma-54 [Chloroflexota bacterium]
MELEQSQSLQPQTTVAITANLITSLKILQLSSDELQQTIEQEIVNNPFLELDERETCAVCGSPLIDGRCPECSSEPAAAPADTESSTWDDDSYDAWRIDTRPNNSGDDEYDPVALAAGEMSLQDYLLDSLLSTIPSGDAAIAEYLIGSLDDSGYLTVEDDEVAAACGVPVERVQSLVEALQQLDPPGVGARNPRECLIIQLKHLMEDGRGDALALRILEQCFEELGQHKFEAIASRLRIKADHVLTSWAFIKDNLTPFPAWRTWQNGQRLATGGSGVIRPDVAIKPSEDGYTVEVLEEARYQFRINDMYREMMSEHELPSEDREFVRRYTNQAKFFIGFVKERWDTIRQITECISEVQRDFLDHGIRHLKPLTRSEVAFHVGLHESTVSRATANKYILLPSKRVISFDDLFDGSLAIKDAIREIIAAERPERPLSDEEIAAELKEQGMFVARRTVAKYREAIHILPSTLRGRAYHNMQRARLAG